MKIDFVVVEQQIRISFSVIIGPRLIIFDAR